MVTEVQHNMLVALDAVWFEGIVCMAHKLHLVVHSATGLGSHIKPEWEKGAQETWHSWSNAANCGLKATH